jgi:hypothetical protein
MIKDAIIMGRCVQEDSVGGNIFIPSGDISGGPLGLVVFTEGVLVMGSTGKLSCYMDCLLDAIQR